MNFEILKSILFGKIISSSFLLNNFDKNANFSGLNIFLDTNIVFSIMGFHEDFFNDPVNELIKILKKIALSRDLFKYIYHFNYKKLMKIVKNRVRPR